LKDRCIKEGKGTRKEEKIDEKQRKEETT